VELAEGVMVPVMVDERRRGDEAAVMGSGVESPAETDSCHPVDVKPLVIFAPVDVVSSSVALARDILVMAGRQAAARRGVEAGPVLTASLDGRPVLCGAGTTVSVDVALADVDSAALVWVAAFWSRPGPGVERNAGVVPWLALQRADGALVAAHGPGAFLLAESGMLDGRIATTYEALAPEFQQRYPKVDLQTSRLITDGGGVFCCVGMNSGGDLLVRLVERLHGREVAASIASWALVDSQRSYQVALMAMDGQKYHGDNEILQVQQHLERHYARAVTIADVAFTFGMSPRTLTRRFKSATGDTPSDYLSRLRAEVAKDLLRVAHLSVAEVAARVGYRDMGALYDMFAKHTGQRPGAFRTGGGNR
jgi:transcriptional regulator GlxA family with amidase domain